jgi:hypothetical protein
LRRVIRGNDNRAIRGANVGIEWGAAECANKGPAQGPGQDGEETNNGQRPAITLSRPRR